MTRSWDGRIAFGCTVGGLLAAVGCFFVLWLVPVYSSGATLPETEGGRILWLAAFPVVVAVVAWFGLHAACSRGSVAGRVVAAVAVGLLALLTLAGMASIGLVLFPAAALLVTAVVLTPTGPARRG